MKKLIQASLATLILIFVTSPLLMSQYGKVYDNLTMDSEILKMERKFAIYLPPDYELTKRAYPVLCLLHGGCDDQKVAVRWYIDCEDDDFHQY